MTPSRHCRPTEPLGWEAVWTVALDRLAADDPVALALLTLIAWLGTAPVPLTLLTGNPQVLARAPARRGRNSGARRPRRVLDRRGLARFADGALAPAPLPAGLLDRPDRRRRRGRRSPSGC